jgi:ADP-ribosyl-[dinitrogen reductase] hydrolase
MLANDTGATSPESRDIRPMNGSVAGAILGTAVGDALGLPYENLSRRRAARLLGAPDRHRFLFGRGMVSDDTEHTCMVAQALIASLGEPGIFGTALARNLRWWLLGLPAGVGLATLRAILRLWLGISPTRSGVFSAGNGPAMRSAVLGAAVDDLELLRSLVAVSTRITHSDPKANQGALAVALAARHSRRRCGICSDEYLGELQSGLANDAAGEFLELVSQAKASVDRGEQTLAFVEARGWKRGVSGYVYHTVPVCLHAWFRNSNDFRAAVMEVISCGGDTDTMAAIVGGIIGSSVGKEGIPPDWLDRIWEWPRTTAWMAALGGHVEMTLATKSSVPVPRLSSAGLLARNVCFLSIVLLHVARRFLPPY